MMAYDRAQTYGQPPASAERHRRISDDVASLDSWSDALNASHNSASSPEPPSYQFSAECRVSSGSVCHNRVPVVSSVQTPLRYEPRREYDVPLQRGSGPSRYDVVDGAGATPSSSGQSYRPATERVDNSHNHNWPPWFPDQPDAHHRETTSWFNKLIQSPSPTKTHSSNLKNYSKPHAFSTGHADSRNVPRFGIGAQSRLGGSHPHGSSGIVGQNGREDHSNDERGEFGSENLADQWDRESERFKTKFMSAWNNVKYGWTLKTKTNFKYDSPIILLGKCYHRRGEDDYDNAQHHGSSSRRSNMDEFHQDFSSRMWFTYRREFSPLAGSKLTTDCGWGCMLRSGQMLMAQGLISHFLGRDWRVFHEPKPEDKAFYKEILRWFSDQVCDQVPFSIHKLVAAGRNHGKNPGNWYGPASLALILRDALKNANNSIPILNDVCVYVAPDCTVYKQDVLDLCQSRPKSLSQTSQDLEDGDLGTRDAGEWKRALILLIPMRLGGEVLNPIYTECVKNLLANDKCIGIIGGKPKHSLYFVGWQEEKLINLDPHYCQDIVDTTAHDFPVQSFHCVSPRKLPFSKMDPSCTVGFYIKTYAEFKTFVQTVAQIVIPKCQKGLYPLFIFSDARSSDIGTADVPYKEKGRLRIRHHRIDRDGKVRSGTIESEDFVIL